MPSMQEHDTFPGKVYAVTCASGCTITDNKGRTLGECEAGKQTLVIATSDKLLTSADALLTATFNSAPAKLRLLGLLGGGVNDTLPAGYLAAEFLESSGTQYIKTAFIPNDSSGLAYECERRAGGDCIPFGCRNSNSTLTRFYAPRYEGYSLGYGWGSWLYLSYDLVTGSVKYELNFKNSRKALAVGKYSADLTMLPFTPTYPVYIFAANIAGTPSLYATCRIWNATLSQEEKIVHDYIPALDPQGVPCMVDKVSKTPFYNSGTGAFIVGMTLPQARKLGKLPATGGTLTVSLPTGYDSDEGVVSALETARANGWTLTVQTYKAETATTTYALRRVWVRKTQDENGAYVDAEGNRWQVEWCVDMLTPDDSEPDAHGYELFRSVDAATEYWGLTQWVDPNAEEILTETTTNE